MTGKKWVEVEAPANIALIKYWGKRDEDLIIPLNDSVSLSISELRAKTRVELVPGSGHDSVTINDTPAKNPRFAKSFDEVRRLLRKRKHNAEGDGPPALSFRVSSTTNFPVAAGLASSAAGFAAIAYAMGQLFDFSEAEVSRIARIGSGSACRSVAEGLVHWQAGSDPTGIDCFAKTVVPHSHWPELRAVILVLNENEKETSSTVGMRTTSATSALLAHRVKDVVPERVRTLIDAFKAADFEKLAGIIMADSNQFHAVCMDTMPPLKYMNDSSWEIIRFVHDFNKDRIRAAYTFDAGPNACIFLQGPDLAPFLTAICEKFHVSKEVISRLVADSHLAEAPKSEATTGTNLNNIIVSRVGEGPSLCASG